MSEAKTKAIAVGIGVLVVLSLITAALAYKQVPEGNEGVTKQWGAVTGETLDSGAHWKIPIMESVQNVEVRPRTYTMSQSRGEGKQQGPDAINVKTVNGSTVAVDITVRYRIDEEQADQFVRDWNNEQQMERRLIRPTIRSQLRDEASDIQTTGTNGIYTREGREALAQTAREALLKEFEDEPIVLEAVQIRNIDLPDSIDQTLDQKEQAKQQVQVEQEKVEQAKQRKRQQIIEAEADAESIEIRAEAYQENPIILQAEYIESIDNGSVFVVPQNGTQPVIFDGR